MLKYKDEAERLRRDSVPKSKVREMLEGAVGSLGCETCYDKNCVECKKEAVDAILEGTDE